MEVLGVEVWPEVGSLLGAWLGDQVFGVHLDSGGIWALSGSRLEEECTTGAVLSFGEELMARGGA